MIVRPILVVLLLSICLSAVAQQSVESTAAPDSGGFGNGAYTNNYFGFSYPLGAEWTEGKDSRSNKSGPEGVYFLFIGDRHLGHPLMDRVVLTADHATGYSSGFSLRDYVAKMTAGYIAQGNGALIKEAYPVDFAGAHFYRTDHKLTSEGVTLYKSFVCTKRNDYWLGWTFVAASPQELEEVVRTLSQIHWKREAEPEPAHTRPLKASDASPQSSAVPIRIRVSAAIAEGMLKEYVAPVYPAEAKKNHVQGIVVFKALVSRDGDVKTLDVISGDPVLAAAATDAVKQWIYRPYLLDGKPVEVETQVKVNFELSGK